MEIWLIYAIISVFVSGIFNFLMKVISHRNYNTSYVSIVAYFTWSILAIIYYLINNFWNYYLDNFWIYIVISFFNTFFYFLSTLTRVKSMDSVDTTIFFPLYKTFSPIFITLISLFIFWENLNLKESLWIIVWICVPLMLLTKTENKIQKNLKLWLFFVILTSIFASISNWFNKSLYNFGLNLDLFIVFSLIFWTLISLISYKYFGKESKKVYSEKWVIKFWILMWIIHLVAFYVFTKAVEWNLAIAYTINSFSILIPIILSVIFYKEEMTFKKGFVIFLSIISMLLFI